MKEQKQKTRGGGSATKRSRWLLIGGVAFVVAAIVAVAIYMNRLAPFRVTVLSVNEVEIDMRTFIRRCYLAGQEPLAMLRTLSDEQIIRQVAPLPPYEIEVTAGDIEAYLKSVARGDSESITESDFQEWYRQQLNETQLSEQEFVALVRTRLLRQGLAEHLAGRVPTVAEQVRISMIPVEGMDTARNARERVLAGEELAAVAREMSVDAGLRRSGGDAGWHPRGAMLPHLARVAFDELNVGQVSEPLYLEEGLFAVMVVTDRAAARDLDDPTRRILQGRALEDWLTAERKRHEIDFYGFSGAYDSATDAWVKWQIARMRGQE